MFCSKCGTQIPENSKFCINCGTQINNVTPATLRDINMDYWKSKFDTSTIINIIISVVMILAMLVLPMFNLSYAPNYKHKAYTISLLGDNYTK